MSKCKGCHLQSHGFDLHEKKVKYCIGSPETQPKYGSELKVNSGRIIFTKDTPIYRANDEDECHLWSSERFIK